MLKASDSYREKFLELATSEGLLSDSDGRDLTGSTTRDDLGISSLNIILLISTYLERNASEIEFDTAWVPSLESLGGITSVMREIDERHAARP